MPNADMPCVWCLVLIEGRPYEDATVVARDRSDPARPGVPVQTWAEAQDAYYGSGLVLVDHNGVRCNLMSHTLIGGDAVCIGHAVAVMRSRLAG